jgi:hypothetical protein
MVSQSQAEAMIGVYQFRESGRYWKGNSPTVCAGLHSKVSAVIDTEEMKALFGGYVVYESGGGDEYIGVWGGRNASRLRRLLRERGAALHLVPGSPPDLRVKVIAVSNNRTETFPKSA